MVSRVASASASASMMPAVASVIATASATPDPFPIAPNLMVMMAGPVSAILHVVMVVVVVVVSVATMKTACMGAPTPVLLVGWMLRVLRLRLVWPGVMVTLIAAMHKLRASVGKLNAVRDAGTERHEKNSTRTVKQGECGFALTVAALKSAHRGNCPQAATRAPPAHPCTPVRSWLPLEGQLAAAAWPLAVLPATVVREAAAAERGLSGRLRIVASAAACTPFAVWERRDRRRFRGHALIGHDVTLSAAMHRP